MQASREHCFFLVVSRSGQGTQVPRPTLSTDALGKVHDIVQLTLPHLSGLSEKLAEMYASGQSQREIAKALKVSKSSVQGTLVRLGVPIRPTTRDLRFISQGTFGRKPGFSPYGFAYLEGRLERNPKEAFVVQKILVLWNSGLNFRAVTAEINRSYRTRKGTCWDHSLVSNLIRRVSRREHPYHQFPQIRSPAAARRRSDHPIQKSEIAEQQPTIV